MSYLKKELYELIRADDRVFDFIQDTSLDGLWYWDIENPDNEWMNPRFWMTLGYDPHEMPHQASVLEHIVYPDDFKLARDSFARHCENPEYPYDQVIRYKHKNGGTVWIRCRGLAIRDQAGRAIRMLGAHIDVTREKENEQSHKILFNSIDEGFCVIEMIFGEHQKPVDYRFIAVNAAFERQTGLNNAVGRRMREFAPDHEDHWFEIYGNVALTGESLRFENRAEQLGRWYDVCAFRFGDPKNMQVAILFNDITQRKLAEEQLLEKNNELEAFSYSVAHDLRSPLRSVHGFAEMLNQDYGKLLDDEGHRMIASIKNNASRMGKLIDDLLAFSRLGRKELHLDKVDMIGLTQDVLNEVNRSVTHKAQILINGLAEVMGDYSLLYQVMINLISNALKYSSKRGSPVVEISSTVQNNEVIFSVKDNGAGFDMKYADKLFGVFKRLHTEREFEGTGIGLAIVARIITKHGGKIWAEGKVDEGAAFYFSLPLTNSNT